jgi:hypothetical protein
MHICIQINTHRLDGNSEGVNVHFGSVTVVLQRVTLCDAALVVMMITRVRYLHFEVVGVVLRVLGCDTVSPYLCVFVCMSAFVNKWECVYTCARTRHVAVFKYVWLCI